MLENLIRILKQPTLVNSAELREISGLLYVIFLMPEETAVVKQSLHAGQAYNSEARRRMERRGSSAMEKDQEDAETWKRKKSQAWGRLI